MSGEHANLAVIMSKPTRWLIASSLACLALGLLANRYLVLVTVSGSSMQPTFQDGDRVLVLRMPPRLIRRGAIVVAKPPDRSWVWQAARAADSSNTLPAWIVKRVAGLPGAQVPESSADVGSDAGIVPPGHFFLVGDGPVSVDSRLWGPVPFSNVLGIAAMRLPAHPVSSARIP
jgi:signal peptidase I